MNMNLLQVNLSHLYLFLQYLFLHHQHYNPHYYIYLFLLRDSLQYSVSLYLALHQTDFF